MINRWYKGIILFILNPRSCSHQPEFSHSHLFAFLAKGNFLLKHQKPLNNLHYFFIWTSFGIVFEHQISPVAFFMFCFHWAYNNGKGWFKLPRAVLSWITSRIHHSKASSASVCPHNIKRTTASPFLQIQVKFRPTLFLKLCLAMYSSFLAKHYAIWIMLNG